jgi:lipopolysaccharide transport system ATP-binding protein
MGALAAPFRPLRRALRPALNGPGADRARASSASQYWALTDVGCDVKPGEVIGIIGSNGAGKSTLLKVLSRVTEPTSGRVEMRGRVGSLLEVGTGFHPELTGRENVFLSGSILGMSRREIARKFDEIISFAEIEQFLDTPVKRYSSGMYVRLAFAVAAHLEPEILIVDEVLAVGDAAFQKKCLQRMQDAGRDGRTILFVSHNLAALQSLCSRGIVLERGRLVHDGNLADAATYYLRKIEVMAASELSQRTDRSGAGRVRLSRVEICGDGPDGASHLVMGRPARFVFHLAPAQRNMTCTFSLTDAAGCVVTRFNSAMSTLDDAHTSGGAPVMICDIEEMLLAPGRYRLDVGLTAGGEVQDSIVGAAFFDVVRAVVRGREPPRANDWVVCLPHRWHNFL